MKANHDKPLAEHMGMIQPAKNRGMTYVELIVVLSIFSIMSSVAIFNYGTFQSKVEVENIGSDIALEMVQAQKESLGGKLPAVAVPAGWRPSYGVFFSATDQKNFFYFVDANNDKLLQNTGVCAGECLRQTTITREETISAIDVYYAGSSTPSALSNVTVTFARPDSGATIRSSTAFTAPISYIQLTINSPKGPKAYIKIYPSGRIEVR